LSVLLIYI